MRIAPLLALLVACGNDHALEPTTPEEPVYFGQVDRILRDNCVECHSDDPDRLAPFSLAGVDNAVAAAESTPIAFSVMNRVMPPYYAKNDGSCQTFEHTKWLSDEDIDVLVRWANGAHLTGDAANATPDDSPAPPQITVDRTIDIGTDYMPKGTADDYRCFVLDPLQTENTYLTGVHVRPGNATIVHHVILYTVTADAESGIVDRDAADPEPGYTCTNGPGDGASFLTGWAPGAGAQPFPADTGLLVPGGRKLVIQVHYNSANANGLPDRTRLDLDLAPSVAKRAAIISVRGDVNLPPREVDALAVGTELVPSVGSITTGRVWGGAIHMHTRGTGAQVHVERGGEQCLLDLDGWSFHWQHFYWYAQPVTVSAGDTLRVTCHYDTSGDTQTITWGEGTNDEMCLAYLYVSL